MDTAQWPQEIGLVNPMEETVPNACPSRPVLERSRTRPQKEQALNCPRCNSTNTKFCYYNNYSLTQPRYFCKTCRRYWTEGGSLRNVPVGGGSRKNKRSSSSSSSSLSIASATATSTSSNVTTSNTLLSSKIKHDPDHLQNPKINEGQDLNLGFPASAQDYPRIPAEFIELPSIENRSNNNNSSSTTTTTTTTTATTTTVSALDLLRSTTTGITSTGIGLSSFMPMPLTVPLPDINAVYSSSGFGHLQDFKQQSGLNFVGVVDDGLGLSGAGYGGLQLGSGSNGRLLIPFEELKPSTDDHQYDQNIRGQAAEGTGYWSGMLGGAGSW